MRRALPFHLYVIGLAEHKSDRQLSLCEDSSIVLLRHIVGIPRVEPMMDYRAPRQDHR